MRTLGYVSERGPLLQVIVALVVGSIGCGRIGYDEVTSHQPVCGGRDVLAVPESGLYRVDPSMLNDDAVGACGGEGAADVVFAVDVPTGGSLVVSADDGPNDTLIYIRSRCDDPASELVCNNDGGVGANASFRLIDPGGGSYFVFFDRDGVDPAPFDARFKVLLPLGATCGGLPPLYECGPETTCSGSTCAPVACASGPPITIAALGVDSIVDVTTTGLTNRHASTCSEGLDGGVRSPDLELAIDLQLPARLSVSTDAPETTFDTIIYLRRSCTGSELACDDDSGVTGNNRSLFVTDPLQPGTYTLVVDGFGGTAGNARVIVRGEP